MTGVATIVAWLAFVGGSATATPAPARQAPGGSGGPRATETQVVYYDWVEDAVAARVEAAGGVAAALGAGAGAGIPLRGGRTRVPIDAAPADLSSVDFLPAVTLWQGSPGSSDNRVDLVFVGDGYQANELDDFDDHVDLQVAAFLTEEPFATYATYFNIHRVDVISNDSGVDNDPTPGIQRDTALNMRFWCNGTERLLCVNTALALGYGATAPDHDYIVAVANSTKYGGAGYPDANQATVSGGNSAASEVMIHELGHSMGDLADEYDYGGPSTWPGGEPGEPNASALQASQMATQGTKWADWLGENQAAFDGLVSTFEGAHYSQFGVYRPTQNSLMRNLGRPFNLPSVEALIVQMYGDVSPIDDASPTTPVYQGDEVLSVTPMQPVGHTLDIQWFSNGNPIAGATGPSLDLAALGLPLGPHTISVEVVDPTPWVRDPVARADRLTERLDYSVVVSLVKRYCQGAPNSAGPGATLSWLGSTSVGANDALLAANSAALGQLGLFYYGSTRTETPFGDGFRCVGGTTYRLSIVQTDPAFGDVLFPLDLTSPPQPSGEILAGSTWHFQFWYRDPAAAGTGHNLSDALEASFVP